MQVEFRNTMDHLSIFMKERRLQFGMRRALREFFMAARDVNQVKGRL